MAANDTIKIALWGPTECGKTSYLICLHYYLLRHRPEVAFEPVSPDAQRFIADFGPQLEKGILPRPTDRTEGVKIYQFHLYSKKQKKQIIELNLIDAAGTLITNEEYQRPYFGQITDCSGLIMLIDSTQDASKYSPALGLMEFLVQGRARTNKGIPDVFLSVCLSKIDKNPGWVDYESSNFSSKHVRKRVMEEFLGRQPDVFRFIENYEMHQRAAFIGQSSVGRLRNGSNLISAPHGSVIRNFDLWQPHNMETPVFEILRYYYPKASWLAKA
jgi:GTPase SAR1 family protein